MLPEDVQCGEEHTLIKLGIKFLVNKIKKKFIKVIQN